MNETPPLYISLSQLAAATGLPQAYLKRQTDAGKLPYLEPLAKKRAYCLLDVQMALSQLAHANMKQDPESPIDFTEFSTRVAKVLKILRIETWEQLATVPKQNLLAGPNFGATCLKEVEDKLAYRQRQGNLWDPKNQNDQKGGPSC